MIRRVRGDRSQSGFTLIELIIGIALMGVISAGLLMAMRNGLQTLGRVNARLDENRRAMSTLNLIRRQIAAAIPARAVCPAKRTTPTDIFSGDGSTLVLVTSESLAQGSRGYPQIARYQFRPNVDGTVRLEVIEVPFPGPYGAQFCPPNIPIPAGTPPPVVLYDRLAGGRFSYLQTDPFTRRPQGWTGGWPLPYMPAAVRIELIPAWGSAPRLPLGSITIPLRTSREPDTVYKDENEPPPAQ